jgi:Spy/CpxP family protein refolding chaperone
VIRAILAAALLAGALAVTADTKALVEGEMPDDPAKPLVQGKCLLCHTADYLTQQRLTETQWQKTVDKMRKFGTPASDDEAKLITAYLARYWTQDLPPAKPVKAAPPRK